MSPNAAVLYCSGGPLLSAQLEALKGDQRWGLGLGTGTGKTSKKQEMKKKLN
jgi:hypothetical protein